MEKHFEIKERSRPFFMIHSLYVHLLNVLSSDAKNSFMSKCACVCGCVWNFELDIQSGCIFVSTKVKTIFYLPFSLSNVILFSYISTTIDFRKNNGRTSFLVQNKKEILWLLRINPNLSRILCLRLIKVARFYVDKRQHHLIIQNALKWNFWFKFLLKGFILRISFLCKD